jgi:hypothetical protein
MSMDISIWSTKAPTLPHELPRSDSWQQHEYRKPYYQFLGDGWLVNVEVGEGTPIAALLGVMPNASFVTYVSLEPIGASAEGYDFLESVVRTTCEACNGLWEHPGNGRFYSHDGGVF